MLLSVVLILFLSTIKISESTPKPRLTRAECRQRDNTTQSPHNRSVDIYNFCVITSTIDENFEHAKLFCNEYEYGRLFVVNHLSGEEAFKKVLKDKWQTGGWKFWVLWTTKEQEYPYPLFTKDGPLEVIRDPQLKIKDCHRLGYEATDFARTYWLGHYCFISSWTTKTWEEANESCDMFRNGQLIVVDTMARKDELKYALLTEWGVSRDQEYSIGRATRPYERPTFNKLAVFHEAEDRKLPYICQYPVEDYACKGKMEACGWLLQTGETVELCVCPINHTCVALPHLGPGMKKDQRDGVGKVISTLNFYMGFRTEFIDRGLVTASCQHNVN